MSGLDDLYQAVILEHDRSPRNFRVLGDSARSAEGYNPLCGDRVKVMVDVNGSGTITDVAFQGMGCAISKASASLMTEALKGRTIAEAQALFEKFHGLLTGDAVGDREALGKLVVFGGVKEYPMRVKCATLAWHALRDAIGTQISPSPPITPAGDAAPGTEPEAAQ